MHEEDRAEIPQRRIGSPEGMADALEFLVGEKSAYLTGQKFIVDGGQFMWRRRTGARKTRPAPPPTARKHRKGEPACSRVSTGTRSSDIVRASIVRAFSTSVDTELEFHVFNARLPPPRARPRPGPAADRAELSLSSAGRWGLRLPGCLLRSARGYGP
ncbi:SDR family oxidoreductase [Streptomyces sp. UNOC14_S4]|uniref:SDR family oxidoreductase n=1 Tax=Streptomyces sp. UNOC14_S4 TaxID=2872340 RepID=UPI001E50C952|nr:SDR family oxidoreductase [Streptomyces sp. UNOC14_S4]